MKKNYLWVQQKSWKLHHMTIFFFAFNQIFHSCCKKFNNREILRASNVSERERIPFKVNYFSIFHIAQWTRLCLCLSTFLLATSTISYKTFCMSLCRCEILAFFLTKYRQRKSFLCSLACRCVEFFARSLSLPLLHSHAAMPMWLIVIFSFLFLSPSKFIFLYVFLFPDDDQRSDDDAFWICFYE